MKKIIAAFIAGALVATVSSVYGESVFKPIKETVYSRADIKMTLNGKLLQFENTIIEYDHKTFFPVRELANKLGATVDWDEKSQTIVLEKEAKDIENNNNTNENNDSDQMEYKIIDSSDIISNVTKYGFKNVYRVNDIEYVPIAQIAEEIYDKGIYLHPVLDDNAMLLSLQLKRKDNNNEEILIPHVPAVHIELYWSIDYSYYTDKILPLINE